MKHRSKRARAPLHPPAPRDLLRQPKNDFYRLPELAIRGGVILTEGCCKVLDFAPQKLCLDMGAFVVTFYGRELRIESLNGKRAAVVGRVARIDFATKWEGQDGTV